MKEYNSLKKLLNDNSGRLVERARSVCRDEKHVYCAIYRAIVKTKRIYDNLSNKERAIDICLGKIKDTGSGNSRFSSVEECIDMAMCTRVIRIKPIILAAALILCLTLATVLLLNDGIEYIEPEGFTIKGSFSIGNSFTGNDNDIYLKNLISLKPLGVGHGTVCDSIVTRDKKIYLVTAYSDKEGAKMSLYVADENGWQLLGSDSIKVHYTEHNGVRTYGVLSQIKLFESEEGYIYITSVCDVGIQVHRYKDGSFSLADRMSVDGADNTLSMRDGTVTNRMISDLRCVYDSSNDTIGMIYYVLDESTNDFNYRYKTVVFDIPTDGFEAERECESALSRYDIDYVISDNRGGFYATAKAELYNNGTVNKDKHEACLLHIKDGYIESRVQYVNYNHHTVTQISLMLFYEDGMVHQVFCYGAKMKTYIYALYDGEEVVKSYRIYTHSMEEEPVQLYFIHNGEPHYIAVSDSDRLKVYRVSDKRTTDLCDIRLPFAFDMKDYVNNRVTECVSGSDTVNAVFTVYGDREHSSYEDSCFAQIIIR